jgi:hypothetical protein
LKAIKHLQQQKKRGKEEPKEKSRQMKRKQNLLISYRKSSN